MSRYRALIMGSSTAVALAVARVDLTSWRWWVAAVIFLTAAEVTR